MVVLTIGLIKSSLDEVYKYSFFKGVDFVVPLFICPVWPSSGIDIITLQSLLGTWLSFLNYSSELLSNNVETCASIASNKEEKMLVRQSVGFDTSRPIRLSDHPHREVASRPRRRRPIPPDQSGLRPLFRDPLLARHVPLCHLLSKPGAYNVDH